MVIKLNLNKKQDEGFEPLKPGTYEVTVVNFEPRSAGDKNIISVDYEIRLDVDQEFKGRKIRKDDFFCTEKALWKIENASIAAGFTEEESTFEKYTEWAQKFVGKQLQVEVFIEERNGFKNERVKRYLPTAFPTNYTDEKIDDSVPF